VLVSARLYGAEEFVEDGENGWVVERDVLGVRSGLLRILADRSRLSEMGSASRLSVRQYSQNAFESRWIALYSGSLDCAAKRVVACLA
jgi:glycosyltransferase involved in cell wall biosynthesis